MKLTCDLCGGTLQINMNGQSASCTNCGLGYTMEYLRGKLQGKVVQQVSSAPVPLREVSYSKPVFDFEPKQFVMKNDGKGIGDLSGWVQQGGIGLGDSVYIDGDYAHPYRIYSINDDENVTRARSGMPVELFLADCPRRILKKARIVTGDPEPVANCYNYPGTIREYFSDLLRSKFSEYTIRTDIRHDQIKIPADLVFCKDGKKILAVFLINSNNSQDRYQVEKAVRIYESEGISCIHFFENYRNDMPYVVQRIRRGLSHELK